MGGKEKPIFRGPYFETGDQAKLKDVEYNGYDKDPHFGNVDPHGTFTVTDVACRVMEATIDYGGGSPQPHEGYTYQVVTLDRAPYPFANDRLERVEPEQQA